MSKPHEDRVLAWLIQGRQSDKPYMRGQYELIWESIKDRDATPETVEQTIRSASHETEIFKMENIDLDQVDWTRLMKKLRN